MPAPTRYVVSMERMVAQTITILVDAPSATEAIAKANVMKDEATWREWYADLPHDCRATERTEGTEEGIIE